VESDATVLTNAMASEVSHQNACVLVPGFDYIIGRTAGKHSVGFESDCPNLISMTSETSQLIAGVLVPKLDSVVTGTTGKQVSRVKGN